MGTVAASLMSISTTDKMPNRHELMIKQARRINNDDRVRPSTSHAPAVITRAAAHV